LDRLSVHVLEELEVNPGDFDGLLDAVLSQDSPPRTPPGIPTPNMPENGADTAHIPEGQNNRQPVAAQIPGHQDDEEPLVHISDQQGGEDARHSESTDDQTADQDGEDSDHRGCEVHTEPEEPILQEGQYLEEVERIDGMALTFPEVSNQYIFIFSCN
jgi:hypothetical protein